MKFLVLLLLPCVAFAWTLPCDATDPVCVFQLAVTHKNNALSILNDTFPNDCDPEDPKILAQLEELINEHWYGLDKISSDPHTYQENPAQIAVGIATNYLPVYQDPNNFNFSVFVQDPVNLATYDFAFNFNNVASINGFSDYFNTVLDWGDQHSLGAKTVSCYNRDVYTVLVMMHVEGPSGSAPVGWIEGDEFALHIAVRERGSQHLRLIDVFEWVRGGITPGNTTSLNQPITLAPLP